MSSIEKSFYSKTSMYAFFVVLILSISVWISTGQFKHMDMALLGYLLSSLIFAIGLTIRMCAWLLRPATHKVIHRSFKNLRTRERKNRNLKSVFITALENIFLQKFIFKRGLYRGIQHWLISWGCIGSFAITFGLTFGWMRFDLIDPETYQIVVFNIPTMIMPAHGLLAEIIYNGLNITASLVLIGACMALYRRIKDNDVKVTQRFEFDILPLYILLAVTITGLFLTVSYVLLEGFMHHYLTLIHQVTVVILLIYFPFGKLFHLPIRPLTTAVPMNYQEKVQIDTRPCHSCGAMYSNDDQISDVKGILDVQSFDLQLEDGTFLADYCPACRRRIRVMKQLNMGGSQGNPFQPIETRNGIQMSGFGKKRSEDFYESDSSENKQTTVHGGDQ
ncbi:MFS transporter [Pontibacillus yanchengensis]|uniref:MFS transporter n=2 Tax=Pontibacillus yanchengensis TaxID=462910 RepID=A0ACC7VBR3_9BACI|nr:MFS transporter [Pontibacillus yanchengensis]MYL34689.1 MFS transporter [Pontibacillus yanchengensis]MYL52326.1 MFS transporter [Pontibacillus yanchengensis]